ncbi:MAG: hypothetical protein QW334_03285 [Thermofilum sp.]
MISAFYREVFYSLIGIDDEKEEIIEFEGEAYFIEAMARISKHTAMVRIPVTYIAKVDGRTLTIFDKDVEEGKRLARELAIKGRKAVKENNLAAIGYCGLEIANRICDFYGGALPLRVSVMKYGDSSVIVVEVSTENIVNAAMKSLGLKPLKI